MLKKLKSVLWHTKGMIDFINPNDSQTRFKLSYNKLVIGYLSLEEGKWSFEYSEDFKKQNDILPLSNFPNKEFEYISKELWPFFTSRIPSAAQLESKSKCADIDLKERNVVALLEKYGHRTITNPFILQPAG